MRLPILDCGMRISDLNEFVSVVFLILSPLGFLCVLCALCGSFLTVFSL